MARDFDIGGDAGMLQFRRRNDDDYGGPCLRCGHWAVYYEHPPFCCDCWEVVKGEKDTRTMNNELITASAELGKALVDKATETRKKRMSEMCVAEVETVLSLIDQASAQIVAWGKKKDVYTRRLAAIESGNITINADNSGRVVITYNDPDITPEKTGL